MRNGLTRPPKRVGAAAYVVQVVAGHEKELSEPVVSVVMLAAAATQNCSFCHFEHSHFFLPLRRDINYGFSQPRQQQHRRGLVPSAVLTH